MIVITGATGTVGREIIRQLSANKVGFLAVVRNPERARRVLGPDVDIIYGDYSNPGSLDTAFREATKVYLASPSDEHQVQNENNVVDAAVRAGVDHLVKLSVMGASPYSDIGFFRFHYLVEMYIKDVGLPYTFLRPNTFMQNLLGQAGSIMSQGRFYGSVNDGKVSWIDARDVASAATTALTTEGLIGQTFELTGPEALSFSDAARILSDVLDKPVEYVNMPDNAMKQAFLDRGLPEWRAEDYAEFQHLMAEGLGALISPDAERVLGRPPISFQQFAHDYAQAFQQAQAA